MLLLAVLVIWLSGCSAAYEQQIVNPITTRLVAGHGVYISKPKNGRYGKIEYRESGIMTANSIKSAFSRFSTEIHVPEACLGKECLGRIPVEKYTYYVAPEILHWEDRATEWSELPDKIEIKVVIYDIKSGREITSAVLSGRSKWATFGGDHPQDLLPEPVNQFVQSLY
jgi:hypothetical protein